MVKAEIQCGQLGATFLTEKAEHAHTMKEASFHQIDKVVAPLCKAWLDYTEAVSRVQSLVENPSDLMPCSFTTLVELPDKDVQSYIQEVAKDLSDKITASVSQLDALMEGALNWKSEFEGDSSVTVETAVEKAEGTLMKLKGKKLTNQTHSAQEAGLTVGNNSKKHESQQHSPLINYISDKYKTYVIWFSCVSVSHSHQFSS